MCNQWGDHGYFNQNVRQPSHMPLQALTQLLDSRRQVQQDFLLSVHGGEPFAYREMHGLLDYLAYTPIDTLFSTNGTLLSRYAKALARINPRTVYLLSIDGDEHTNDNIRGDGVTARIRQSIQTLRQACLEMKTGSPKIIVNYCLSEYNSSAVNAIIPLAKELGALTVNFNLRWFMPEKAGNQYDVILQQQFAACSSGAWRGWLMDRPVSNISTAISHIYRLKRRWYPPFISILPRRLSPRQATQFYQQYDETFGINACVMPSYQVRIHSSGELIYCPGHPDIIPGNVFTEGFDQVYTNGTSQRLRNYVENRLLPICNRCCGLYMTDAVTKHLGAGYDVQTV